MLLHSSPSGTVLKYSRTFALGQNKTAINGKKFFRPAAKSSAALSHLHCWNRLFPLKIFNGRLEPNTTSGQQEVSLTRVKYSVPKYRKKASLHKNRPFILDLSDS